MPHGPFYVPSRGACIYCGATDAALSDEHVVPYGLGGSHVLRKASCCRCAAITSKFERKVMRELWGDDKDCIRCAVAPQAPTTPEVGHA